MLGSLPQSYRGKRVLVTGHTGFKGSWLTLWLQHLGAEVTGYSLAPITDPAMFDLCDVASGIDHRIADIRHMQTLSDCIASTRPDVIMHLAAQPIVREAYLDPLGTLSTNVIGTANLLEAVRTAGRPCNIVVVTSDKCYENEEWVWGYRENDPMGGKDPYSMSKGATELVVSSWRRSFFSGKGAKIRLASARAGNVLGGGDWAKDRIMTDAIAALTRNEPVVLRNPLAVRPWQHVLEPLGGYLLLGAKLMSDDGDEYCSGWNFGPRRDDVKNVATVIDRLAARWGAGSGWTQAEGEQPAEANLLSLNCDKAAAKLDWAPVWTLDQLLQKTVIWYQAWADQSRDLRQLSTEQILEYQADANGRSA